MVPGYWNGLPRAVLASPSLRVFKDVALGDTLGDKVGLVTGGTRWFHFKKDIEGLESGQGGAQRAKNGFGGTAERAGLGQAGQEEPQGPPQLPGSRGWKI